MTWWFYLVAIPAAFLLVNGVPHFTQGIAGKRFATPFSGGPGTEGTPVANVLWGSSNFIVGGILLWLIRDGLSDIWMVTELVVLGVAVATLLAAAFGNPERFGWQRK